MKRKWMAFRNPNAQNEFENDTIETIYFGGGTPSIDFRRN
jgi:coproporphyrinogen III oxidase-like Fe-S oxidoreductase